MLQLTAAISKDRSARKAMNSIVPLLVMALVVGSIAGLFILASALLGPKKRSKVKDEPFECGLPSEGVAHKSSPVRFYLMALLFILFDVELAFLFPWAVVFRSLGMFGFVEMLVFFVVVGVGFVYAWKIGALEWE
jgi:NADH-quinone oxidoreductase subunit A